MLFPGKKCHDSGHQPVVLGIVDDDHRLTHTHTHAVSP